jgi:hypothetical protein
VLAAGIVAIALVGIGAKLCMKHRERCALRKRCKNTMINAIKNEIINSVGGRTVSLQDNVDNYMKRNSKSTDRVKVNEFSIMNTFYTKPFAEKIRKEFTERGPVKSEKILSDNDGLKMLLNITPHYEVPDTCSPGYFVKVTEATFTLTITNDTNRELFVSQPVKFSITSQQELVDNKAVESLLVSSTKEALEDRLDNIISDENWIS